MACGVRATGNTHGQWILICLSLPRKQTSRQSGVSGLPGLRFRSDETVGQIPESIVSIDEPTIDVCIGIGDTVAGRRASRPVGYPEIQGFHPQERASPRTGCLKINRFASNLAPAKEPGRIYQVTRWLLRACARKIRGRVYRCWMQVRTCKKNRLPNSNRQES